MKAKFDLLNTLKELLQTTTIPSWSKLDRILYQYKFWRDCENYSKKLKEKALAEVHENYNLDLSSSDQTPRLLSGKHFELQYCKVLYRMEPSTE